MNPRMLPWLASFALCYAGLANAIDPGEVRDFGDVFAVSAKATAPDRIEVTWDIAPNYYLYDNQFLSFGTSTPGVVLGTPDIPAGETAFDELLGEQVIKYHHRLSVGLPIEKRPPGVSQVTLDLRSQGCLEGVLCYPPTKQAVTVSLPAVAAAGTTDSAPPEGDLAPDAGTDALAPLKEMLAAGAPKSVAGDAPALPAEQAFVYEAIGLDPGTALVRFTAQPGYYLYVDKFAFRVIDGNGISVGRVELPKGTTKDDPEFGHVPVVYDQVEIPVHLVRPAGPAATITLQADFQGCRDGDICYPPQERQVALRLDAAPQALGGDLESSAGPAPAPRSAPGAPVTEQGRLARLLVDNPAGALLAFFFAGLLLAFTPCVFPMVPILSGVIAGEGDNINPRRAFWLSLVYVLAMAATYTVAGVLAGLFGKNLQAMFQEPWVIGVFVAVFVVLALSMFGLFQLQLPHRWQTALHQFSSRHKGGKFGGVAMLGIFSALIVGPCVAPPLAAALIVIGESGSPVLGGSALFTLSLGMGVPLIVFGVTAGEFMPRAGRWMNVVKDVFGVGLLALAIWMLQRILPGEVIMLLWGALAIGSGVYLRALERLPEDASGWRRLWKSLGLMLLLLGAIEFLGAAAGGDDWLRPLGSFAGAGPARAEAEEVPFRRVKSLADVEAAVAAANERGAPPMLDFYADWCVECIRMERNTFPEPEIQELLARMQPLQADVTANDDVDQALMRAFGVIGPPAILFFDAQGREMPDYRLVGYFTPEEFAKHLRLVFAAR